MEEKIKRKKLIGEIYVIMRLIPNKKQNIKYSNLFEAAYDFPPRNGI